MDMMHTAIRHNNLGITILQKGQYEEALTEFKQAAQSMYSTTQELKGMALSGVQEPCHLLGSCETIPCPIESNNSFIRSTPLLLSYTGGPTSSCTVESAVVLMNMAMCYHLDSIASNSMQNAMNNAISLYQMSYSLGVQAQHDERAHHLILTSLNNLGQLHHEMGNFDKSRLYLEDLSAYVSFLNEGGRVCSVENCHEFMLNAMVLRNPNSCAGSA